MWFQWFLCFLLPLSSEPCLWCLGHHLVWCTLPGETWLETYHSAPSNSWNNLSTSQHCLTDSDSLSALNCRGVPRLAAEQLSSVNSPMARELQPPSIQPISKIAVLRIGRILGVCHKLQEPSKDPQESTEPSAVSNWSLDVQVTCSWLGLCWWTCRSARATQLLSDISFGSADFCSTQQIRNKFATRIQECRNMSKLLRPSDAKRLVMGEMYTVKVVSPQGRSDPPSRSEQSLSRRRSCFL